MMAIKRRRIERVPAALIGLLEAAGRLPSLPVSVKAIESKELSRNPILSEVTALTWIAEWHGDRVDERVGLLAPIGIAAFRDCYEYASGRDVREVVQLVGSSRSVREMVEWMRKDAQGLPVVGSVHLANNEMNSFLHSSGAARRRIIWEFEPWAS